MQRKKGENMKTIIAHIDDAEYDKITAEKKSKGMTWRAWILRIDIEKKEE